MIRGTICTAWLPGNAQNAAGAIRPPARVRGRSGGTGTSTRRRSARPTGPPRSTFSHRCRPRRGYNFPRRARFGSTTSSDSMPPGGTGGAATTPTFTSSTTRPSSSCRPPSPCDLPAATPVLRRRTWRRFASRPSTPAWTAPWIRGGTCRRHGPSRCASAICWRWRSCVRTGASFTTARSSSTWKATITWAGGTRPIPPTTPSGGATSATFGCTTSTAGCI
mmetsp:Transcript_2201/g.4712  ORF Transcript_2201/g.4712 Transcript_2201/m.4712 type:complete len:221 (+) Transcript_2201:430-1092(+)